MNICECSIGLIGLLGFDMVILMSVLWCVIVMFSVVLGVECWIVLISRFVIVWWNSDGLMVVCVLLCSLVCNCVLLSGILRKLSMCCILLVSDMFFRLVVCLLWLLCDRNSMLLMIMCSCLNFLRFDCSVWCIWLIEWLWFVSVIWVWLIRMLIGVCSLCVMFVLNVLSCV